MPLLPLRPHLSTSSVRWFLVAQALHGLSRAVVLTTVVLVFVEHAGPAAAARVQAGQMLLAAIVGFVVGRLVTVAGERGAARGGLAAIAAACLVLAVAGPTRPAAILAVLLVGAAAAVVRASTKAEMWRRSQQRRHLVHGMIANMTGNTVGAGLVGLAFTTGRGFVAVQLLAAAASLLTWRQMAANAPHRPAVETPTFAAVTAGRPPRRWVPLLAGGAVMGASGSAMLLQTTYVLSWHGAWTAGPIEVAHVAGQLAAAVVLARLTRRLPPLLLLATTTAAVVVSPFVAVAALASRVVASTSGHVLQAEVESHFVAGEQGAGNAGRLAAVTSIVIAVLMAAAPSVIDRVGWPSTLLAVAAGCVVVELTTRRWRQVPASG